MAQFWASCFIYFHTSGLFFLFLPSLIHVFLLAHFLNFIMDPPPSTILWTTGIWDMSRAYIPLHPLLLTFPFLQSSTIPLHRSLDFPLHPVPHQVPSSLCQYTQNPPFLPAIYSISDHGFLVKSLSTATQMSLLSILGFKCNAVNFFCCTWHITRTSERTEAREAPITTQPTPQEPMSAKPRGTSLR